MQLLRVVDQLEVVDNELATTLMMIMAAYAAERMHDVDASMLMKELKDLKEHHPFCMKVRKEGVHNLQKPS